MKFRNSARGLAAGRGAVLALPAPDAQAQTKWNLPSRLSGQQSAHRESRRFRQGGRAGDRRQAADHAASGGLAVQGAGDQARGADRAGADGRGADLDPRERGSDLRHRRRAVPRRELRRGEEAVEGDRAPPIEKKLAAQGIMVLMAVPWGPQGIYAKKDINTVEDMKGLQVARLQRRHRRASPNWSARSR